MVYMLHGLWKTAESDIRCSFLCAVISNKSSYGWLVKKSNWYQDSNEVIVKCSNGNCTEEGTIDIFSVTKYYWEYYYCCGLDLKIIKLLINRNDYYWFCPDCAKPALTAIFIEKYIEEKCQNTCKTLQPRINIFENGYEDMSNLLVSSKVESVKFSEHVQRNTTKIEELESNTAFLTGETKSFQENHQQL